MNIYTENGWNNREDYFNALAIMYSIQIGAVYSLANDIGEEGDFNGELIQAVEKYERDLVKATSPAVQAAKQIIDLNIQLDQQRACVDELEAQRSALYVKANTYFGTGVYIGIGIGIVGTTVVRILLDLYVFPG